MASDFKAAQDGAVSDLVSQLVTTLVGVEEGEENHDLALEYCLGNLAQHRFGDVSPSEVERDYDRLQERLGLQSQLAKQRGLATLRARLMTQQMPTEILEPHHRLLSLIYWLQGLPLQSSFDPSGLEAIERYAAFIPGTETANARDRRDVLDELSDYGDEVGYCGSGSELSDWEEEADEAEDEGRGSEGGGREAETAVDTGQLMVGSVGDGQWGLPPALGVVGEGASMLRPLPDVVAYGEGCLMEALVRERAAGVPVAVPPREACATEDDLLGEALRMFRAVPGRFLVMPKRSDSFVLAPGTHMTDMAPTSVARLMEDFLAAGNRILRIQRFVTYVTNHAIDNGWGSRPLGVTCAPVTPTMAALSANVALCLEECIAAVEPLEDELMGQRGNTAGSGRGGGGLTLLRAHTSLRLTFETLSALEAVVQEAVPRSWCPPSECSSSILTSLFAMLERVTWQADAAGEVLLLRLLLGSLQPYLGLLHTWLFGGEVQDAWEEFFICADRSVSVTSVEFWSKAFSLRRLRGGQGEGQLACPSFLAGVAEGVLAAGKAVHLMTNAEAAMAQDSALGSSGRQRRVLAATAASFGNRASTGGAASLLKRSPLLGDGDGTLFSTFVAAVKSMVRRREVGGKGTVGDGASELRRLFATVGVSAPFTLRSHKIPPPLDNSRSSVSDDSDEPLSGNKSANVDNSSLATDVVDGSFLVLSTATTIPTGEAATATSPISGPVDSSSGAYDKTEWHSYASPPSFAALRINAGAAETVTLPIYKGTEDLLAWGRQQGIEQSLDWLPLSTRLYLPPPSVVLEQCLLRPLQLQIEASGMELLGQAMGPWGLMRELRVLRALFLMASPALEGFAFDLFERLMATPASLAAIPVYELETILKETLPSGSADAPMPTPDSLEVQVQSGRPKAAEAAEAAAARRPHISELADLRIVYKVTRPLELIIDEGVLEVYNRALIFLLQVRWARYALERTRMQLWKSRGVEQQRRGPSAGAPRLSPQEYALMQEMVHFVSNLHQFVMDRNLFASWAELEAEMERACSLDDAIAAHRAFLVKVQRQCLLLPDKTWRLLETAILNILTQILQWCHILQEMIEVGEEIPLNREAMRQMSALGVSFRNNHRYLMRVLQVKTVRIGGYYGLEHLAMRLNYNSWYSSD